MDQQEWKRVQMTPPPVYAWSRFERPELRELVVNESAVDLALVSLDASVVTLIGATGSGKTILGVAMTRAVPNPAGRVLVRRYTHERHVNPWSSPADVERVFAEVEAADVLFLDDLGYRGGCKGEPKAMAIQQELDRQWAAALLKRPPGRTTIITLYCDARRDGIAAQFGEELAAMVFGGVVIRCDVDGWHWRQRPRRERIKSGMEPDMTLDALYSDVAGQREAWT
jgi:hypothetical protein